MLPRTIWISLALIAILASVIVVRSFYYFLELEKNYAALGIPGKLIIESSEATVSSTARLKISGYTLSLPSSLPWGDIGEDEGNVIYTLPDKSKIFFMEAWGNSEELERLLQSFNRLGPIKCKNYFELVKSSLAVSKPTFFEFLTKDTASQKQNFIRLLVRQLITNNSRSMSIIEGSSSVRYVYWGAEVSKIDIWDHGGENCSSVFIYGTLCEDRPAVLLIANSIEIEKRND